MIRGKITFVCDECGTKFKGLDIEWRGTIYSQPLQCPECGSYHTCPWSLFGINKVGYRVIWKSIDKASQK